MKKTKKKFTNNFQDVYFSLSFRFNLYPSIYICTLNDNGHIDESLLDNFGSLDINSTLISNVLMNSILQEKFLHLLVCTRERNK